MIGLAPLLANHLVVIGAHCDDIAIGAGASLLAICRARPGLRVTALVLTGGESIRAAEERSALAAFCPGADLVVEVGSLPDGRLPGHWSEAKALVSALRSRCPDPDLIIAPHRHDAHQDHRLVAELVQQEYRNHLVLGYEILKYESDLPAVAAYHPVGRELVEDKIALLHQHYPSQHGRSWFNADSFRGLLRIRGAQCQQPYAEAFVTEKLRLDLTPQI